MPTYEWNYKGSGASGGEHIVQPDPPSPVGLPDGTMWIDEDSAGSDQSGGTGGHIVQPNPPAIVGLPQGALWIDSDSTSEFDVVVGPTGPIGPTGPAGPPNTGGNELITGNNTFLVAGSVPLSTGKIRWYNPNNDSIEIVSARASVGTPPAGTPLIANILRNGSLLTSLSIPTGTNTSGRILVNQPLPANQYLTMDVTQIGSTTPGSDLDVQIGYAGQQEAPPDGQVPQGGALIFGTDNASNTILKGTKTVHTSGNTTNLVGPGRAWTGGIWYKDPLDLRSGRRFTLHVNNTYEAHGYAVSFLSIANRPNSPELGAGGESLGMLPNEGLYIEFRGYPQWGMWITEYGQPLHSGPELYDSSSGFPGFIDVYLLASGGLEIRYEGALIHTRPSVVKPDMAWVGVVGNTITGTGTGDPISVYTGIIT